MAPRKLELLPLNVHTGQLNAGELLPEHRQDSTDPTTHLEQACPWLELRAIADQAVSPVLGLHHQALLLGRAVAMDVPASAHASRIGRRQSRSARDRGGARCQLTPNGLV